MTILMLGRQLELGHYRAEFLKSYGIHVVFPENKEEAISAVHAGGYDTILLSYTLSNETTKELLSLIEQFCPDCPIIAIMQKGSTLDFNPAETVLDIEPPKMLLEAIKRVETRLLKKENPRFPLSA
jgi:DNA-binding response OmpR family regulator